MNQFNLALDLDKSVSRTPPTVRLRQGDQDGTVIAATIYDHGAALGGTVTACAIVMKLPDGTHYYRKGATYSGGVATVTVDERQAASVVGRTMLAYFTVTVGTAQYSTGAFVVVVEPDAVGDAELPEDYDTAIQEAIDRCNAAAAAIEGALPIGTANLANGAVTSDKLADAVRKGYVRSFETVAAMQAATDLKAGMTCHTNGFHASGDGGAAYYTVSASGTANGMDVLALQGELFATLVVTEPYVSTAALGFKNGDDITDAIESGMPIVLSHDHTISADDLDLDNVTFDGKFLSNANTASRIHCNITKSRIGIRLKDVELRISGNNLVVSDVIVNNLNSSVFMVRLSGCENVTFSDFILKGAYVAGSVTNVDGIHVSHGGKNITICNGVMECGDDAIALCADDGNPIDASLGGDIENIHIVNVVCHGDNCSGIRLLNQNHTISGVYIDNCYFTSVVGPVFRAYYLDNSTKTGTIENVRISNCTLFNNTGIESQTENSRCVYGAYLSDITIEGTLMVSAVSTNMAIKLDECDDVSIIDCKYVSSAASSTAASPRIVAQVAYSKTVSIDGFEVDCAENSSDSGVCVRVLGTSSSAPVERATVSNLYVRSSKTAAPLVLNYCTLCIIENVKSDAYVLGRSALISLTSVTTFINRDAIAQRRFSGELVLANGVFPFTPIEDVTTQFVIAGRIRSTGDIVQAWYDKWSGGFKPVNVTLSDGVSLNTSFTY